MVEHPQHRQNSDGEFGLKDLILIIKSYVEELFRNWLIIAMVCLPLLVYFLYDAIKTPAKYKATLTFMLNEESGSSIGGMASILGQFGLGGGGSEYNLEKIMHLSKSRKIIQTVLFDKAKIGNKEDWIANHIIKEYNYHKNWDEDTTGLKGFYFQHDSIPAFNRVERKVLLTLYKKIKGNPQQGVEGIYQGDISVETGIMSLSCNTTTEPLSIHIVNSLFDKLGKFYVNKTVEKQQQTFNVIKAKADSVQQLLASAEYALAKFKDSSRGLFTKKDGLRESQLKRDISMYSIVLGEAKKNQELSDFTLKNETPFIQVIDEPITPILPTKKSKMIAIIFALLAGGMLSGGFIIVRKLYRDTMGPPPVVKDPEPDYSNEKID